MGSHTFHRVLVVGRCRREMCLMATAVLYRLRGGYLSISQLFSAWSSVETRARLPNFQLQVPR